MTSGFQAYRRASMRLNLPCNGRTSDGSLEFYCLEPFLRQPSNAYRTHKANPKRFVFGTMLNRAINSMWLLSRLRSTATEWPGRQHALQAAVIRNISILQSIAQKPNLSPSWT